MSLSEALCPHSGHFGRSRRCEDELEEVEEVEEVEGPPKKLAMDSCLEAMARWHMANKEQERQELTIN